MTKDLQKKEEVLRENLRALGSVAVAFSGGLDSSFLLKTAHDVLKDNACAVTADTALLTQKERETAREFCQTFGIKHIIFPVDVFAVDGFCANPKNRCYLCKRALFTAIICEAKKAGMQTVAEGTHTDDFSDYRPGLAAIKELGVGSPLCESGLAKAEIRELSRAMGLKENAIPSGACLASRVPYGEEITTEKLAMVEEAEKTLHALGFGNLRVRVHGNLARIELLPEDIPRFADESLRLAVQEKLKEIGFTYTALDLLGYRTGSLNEALIGVK